MTNQPNNHNKTEVQATFHQGRRMFLIKDDEVILGPEDSTLSHKKWFNSMGLDGEKTIRECVRGFADDRGLFFYRGEDFDTDENDERELMKNLGEIAAQMKLPPTTQVYAGVIETGDVRYPPKKTLGAIGKLRKSP